MKFLNSIVMGLLFAAGPLFGRLDQQKVNKWAYDEKATTWTAQSYKEKIEYINANFKGNESTLRPIKKAIEDKWAKKLAVDKKAADELAKKRAEDKKVAEKLAAETRAAEAKLKADQEEIAKKEKAARDAEITRKKLEQEKAAQEKIDQLKAEQEKIRKDLIAAEEKRDQDQKDLYAKIEKEREEAHKTLVGSFELIIKQMANEQIQDVRSLKTELAKTDASLNILPRDAQKPYDILKKTMAVLLDRDNIKYAALRGDFDALEEVRSDTKKLALQLDDAKETLKEAEAKRREEARQRREAEAKEDQEKQRKADETAAKEKEEKERKREERESVERREKAEAKDVTEQAEARAEDQARLQDIDLQ